MIALAAARADAGGGPFGIDNRVDAGDGRGLLDRQVQKGVEYAAIGGLAALALWEGDSTRLGRTTWQAVDASVAGAIAAQGLKVVFSRAGPSQTDDPNRWFQGPGHRSFPSGEVMFMTTLAAPYILEYGAEHPATWALALLPAYDAVARVRARGHWQSDVLASALIGTGIGLYAHSWQTPISVTVLPRAITLGWHTRF